jgi:hypothetical protein
MTERFLLLTRPDCHLCEVFEDALRAHLDGRDYQLEQACVDDRGEWRMRFGQRIPVLLDEAGEVRGEGCFDPLRFDDGLMS